MSNCFFFDNPHTTPLGLALVGRPYASIHPTHATDVQGRLHPPTCCTMYEEYFSQLLPRHALQVSIDKERASPPPPPQKKTYHRYTGGSGPGERLASAL